MCIGVILSIEQWLRRLNAYGVFAALFLWQTPFLGLKDLKIVAQ